MACSTGSQPFICSLNLKAIQNHSRHSPDKQNDRIGFSCYLFPTFVEVLERSWSCFKMASWVVYQISSGGVLCTITGLYHYSELKTYSKLSNIVLKYVWNGDLMTWYVHGFGHIRFATQCLKALSVRVSVFSSTSELRRNNVWLSHRGSMAYGNNCFKCRNG